MMTRKLQSLLLLAVCITTVCATMAQQSALAQNIPASAGQQVYIDHKGSTSLPFRWGSQSHGLMLGIAVVQSTFNRRSPIELWFGVKNVAQVTQSFFRLGDLSDYDVSLRDSNGRLLNPIPGSAGVEFDGSIRPSFSIDPEATFIYKVLDLNDFFELAPGKYTLTATSQIYQNYKEEQLRKVSFVLSSGSVSFEVTASQ